LLRNPARAVRGTSVEGLHVGSFGWSRGVKALCLLFLRSAAVAQLPDTVERWAPFVFSGEAGSPAASLDDAIAKTPNWLLDIFGVTSKGEALIKRLVIRNNPQRKRPGPVRLALRNPENLLINVIVDDEPVVNPDAIHRLADAIEHDWRAFGTSPRPLSQALQSCIME
jgi:hypothetical protein